MGEGLAASYPFLRSLLGPATWSLGATCSIVARGRGRGRLVVEGILEQMGLGGLLVGGVGVSCFDESCWATWSWGGGAHAQYSNAHHRDLKSVGGVRMQGVAPLSLLPLPSPRFLFLFLFLHSHIFLPPPLPTLSLFLLFLCFIFFTIHFAMLCSPFTILSIILYARYVLFLIPAAFPATRCLQ